MKLYLTPHTCALAVDIVAREAGIPLDLVWVDVRAKKLKDGGDFFAVNPKGQVPALQTDDGQVLTEGGVIIQYLCDRHGADALLPGTLGMARYRVLEWLGFITAELHKSFTPLFRPTTPPEYREITIESLRKRLGWIERVLTERDYLLGGAFTAADAYCYSIVIWSHLHKIELDGWPRLMAYLARIEQRPSVQAALAAERQEVAGKAAG
ncbi:MAG: glutathione transferase GstA [Variovorax sp.]